MFQAIAKLWGSVILAMETFDSGIRTVNNVVSVAEVHSEKFKTESLAELADVQAATENKMKLIDKKEAQA